MIKTLEKYKLVVENEKLEKIKSKYTNIALLKWARKEGFHEEVYLDGGNLDYFLELTDRTNKIKKKIMEYENDTK